MKKEDEILATGMTLNEARVAYPRAPHDPENPSPLITTIFCMEGEGLNPRAITDALDLCPTSAEGREQVRGYWLPSGTPNLKKPYWCVERTKQPSYEIDSELSLLLDQLWSKRAAIVGLLKRRGYTAAFVVNVTIYKDRPLYCLSPATLQRLAFFGAEFALDIFDYS